MASPFTAPLNDAPAASPFAPATVEALVIDAIATPVQELPAPAWVLPDPPKAWLIVRAWRGFWSAVSWCLGVAVLVVGLAIIAGIPLLQCMSLGYLLEVAGRIGRTGRLRSGFVGVRRASHWGTLAAGTLLCLLPLELLASLWYDARLLNPGAGPSVALGVVTLLWSAATVLHLLGSWARGGKWYHFLIPYNAFWVVWQAFQPGAYGRAVDHVWKEVSALRLPYYFSLGFRGLFGTLAWLALPVCLLILGSRGAPLPGLVGALFMMFAVLHLPFLQTHFAAENRFSAMFELGTVRRIYGKAPVAHLVAIVAIVALALPVYLLMVELPPQDLIWLPALFCLAFSFPAKLLTGWAYGRGRKREQPRHWFFRWTVRPLLVPIAGFYVFVLYFSQYTNWYGVWGLFTQHAFFAPVPFWGWH